ncbi:MAG TPA: cyclic nucleotide-binding domain-containing protein [Kofleriaceae bacterium]|nr:cyclic nucleotide-binding domain-containing protein [Kofleriaceae bacterium]
MSIHRVASVSCGDCPVGRISGVGRGQFCPFILRARARGEILCLAGDPADYVWHVKSGMVGLSRSRDTTELDDIEAICLPGSFVGLECLFGGPFLRTARVLSPAVLCGATRDGLPDWARQSEERIVAILESLLADPLLADLDVLRHRSQAPDL